MLADYQRDVSFMESTNVFYKAELANVCELMLMIESKITKGRTKAMLKI